MDDILNKNDVDVEEIMRKVKAKMDQNKARSTHFEDKSDINNTDKIPDQVKSEIEFLLNNWNIKNNYSISSHRNLIGPVLVKGRQLVHGEVSRYADPMFARQSEYNLSMANAVNHTAKSMDLRLQSLDSGIGEKMGALRSEINEKTETVRQEINEKTETVRQEIDSALDKKVDERMIAVSQDLYNKSWLARILEDKIQDNHMAANAINSWDGDAVNYFSFEEKFRGSTEDIKQRQTAFIGYFKDCKNVLDIGCGRGEFLELMHENGIIAHGIDVDDSMVEYCTHKGMDVKKIDAITYLESLEDETLDGIFIDQVVEHLEPKYLVKMLILCYQKIKPGYHIFVETVNPISLTSFANFYIDLTHKKPVHPETLRFLIQTPGFKEVVIKFFAPVSEESRLKKIEVDPSFTEKEKSIISVYNYNIEKLNSILYGAQDYAVIGKK